MGFYIPGPTKGKAQYIVDTYGGEIISVDDATAEMVKIEDKKAVICVVDNGQFEAAGYAFDMHEFVDFISPNDYRPKTFLRMNKEAAEKLCGYSAASRY